MLDEANAWGLYNYEKAIYLDGLTDEVIAVAIEQVASKTSPLSYVLFVPLGGAYTDLGSDDTAFGGPRTGYGVFAIGLTRTRDELPAEREWIRWLWQALLPHARGIGSYVNAMVELEPDRIRGVLRPGEVRTGWPRSSAATTRRTCFTSTPTQGGSADRRPPVGTPRYRAPHPRRVLAPDLTEPA